MAAQVIVFSIPRSPSAVSEESRAENSSDFKRHEQALTTYRSTLNADIREHMPKDASSAIHHW